MTLEQRDFMEYALAKDNWIRIKSLWAGSHVENNHCIIHAIKTSPDGMTATALKKYIAAHKKAMAWAAVPYHRRNCKNCVQLALDSAWCCECYDDTIFSPVTYANWRPAHPDYMETEYIRRLHADKEGGEQ